MEKQKVLWSVVSAAGFWKKMALFATLALGIFLDFFIPFMLGYLSIAENLFKSNPDILPAWVITLLTGEKEQVQL